MRVLLALILVTALACSNPCEDQESHCEGKNLRTCGRACEDCDIDWLPDVVCAGACVVEGNSRAFCSITDQPEPLCAGRSGYCAADVQIGCRKGYPVSQTRCEPPPGLPAKASCVELASGLACRATGSGPTADAGARDGESDAPRVLGR